MLRPIGLDMVDLEHREKLMFSDLKKCVAFAFIYFFQMEEVLIKYDGLLKIVHFNRDVINSVNLHAHRSHQSVSGGCGAAEFFSLLRAPCVSPTFGLSLLQCCFLH